MVLFVFLLKTYFYKFFIVFAAGAATAAAVIIFPTMYLVVFVLICKHNKAHREETNEHKQTNKTTKTLVVSIWMYTKCRTNAR